MADSKGLHMPGPEPSLIMSEALHILREMKDGTDRKLVLKSKIKTRNAAVARVKIHRKHGSCVVHSVLKQSFPHSLSL